MTASVRHFGRYDVILLCDGVFEASNEVLTHIDGPTARQNAIETFAKPQIQLDVNCFALRGPNGITLVDAGGGSLFGPAFGLARKGLAEAGITPQEISHVLVTHIHGDHVLGLFENDTAYFPNAEILVPEADFAFFTNAEARAALPETKHGGFKAAEKLQAIYRDRLKRIPNGIVFPGIEAIALPGHTPGHTGYLLNDGDDALLLWGDTLHIAELQPSDPKIGLVYDLDPETAAKTRATTLERAALNGWTVVGGHVGFGKVIKDNQAYRILPA